MTRRCRSRPPGWLSVAIAVLYMAAASLPYSDAGVFFIPGSAESRWQQTVPLSPIRREYRKATFSFLFFSFRFWGHSSLPPCL
ncbi:hypothetical protein BCV70DRAFT_201120 [Testicularia cyperi]|uniref:Uncharacterized protein n=1 Tax=Testicularia cyperi TaxID=1882483 RepID=A0A317XN91_9BASI|nr:hypothetical protein BCV70DRAFT_201120 [Testicularia cyperi]